MYELAQTVIFFQHIKMINMKKVFFVVQFVWLLSGVSIAQQWAEMDKSPMDAAYFPNNFAHDRKAGDVPLIKVIYSRPQMNNREVFGKLVPYGKVWRTGANEATEIRFYKDMQLGGKVVKAGTYSLFTIPGEKEWTIILSNDTDYWGAYSYNEKNDVLRVTAPATTIDTPLENFTIQFDKTGEGQGVMKIAWDKTMAAVPFSVAR